ncbi:unnamed protein product [Adineta ricciae]|nr:unnamed protein product [Adineta ricciae]
MTIEIKEWREKLVRDIGKHADKARNDLDAELKKKKQIIGDQCEKFMKRAAVEEKKKAVDSLRQIRDEWQNLEFKLNELQHQKHEVEYISVAETDSEERSTESKRLSIDQSSVQNQATNGTHDNDMDRNSPSAVNKEIKQNTVMIPTSSEPDRSPRNSDNTTIANEQDDDASNKCPACFMIFPQNMSKNERNEHVNEHFPDGESF